MSKFNILLLGSGGREHALAWKISQSPLCNNLYIGPGNAGTGECGKNVDLDPMKFEGIGDFCLEHDVSFLVIGPEAPLVEGIVDYFGTTPALQSIYCVGPGSDGAQLEGSKSFAKEFMKRHGIPTAGYREFSADTVDEGVQYIRYHDTPVVLKADGLAAGKGVLICETTEEAIREFREMLGGKFGKAGSRVVVEQFLSGIEFSVFVLTDGIEYKILPVAKDYKRIGENDTGLNTGGMGSVSPVPFVDDALMSMVKERIIEPTMQGIRQENLNYAGFIFMGLIKVGGEPFVIEYNCRMGDPETQVVMPRLGSDLVDLFVAMREGKLDEANIDLLSDYAVATVCVSGGYPGSYEKGKPIGLPAFPDRAILFHAGTLETGGKVVTNGGRVLAVTALNADFQAARNLSRTLAGKIEFEGKYYRSDIGFDL